MTGTNALHVSNNMFNVNMISPPCIPQFEPFHFDHFVLEHSSFFTPMQKRADWLTFNNVHYDVNWMCTHGRERSGGDKNGWLSRDQSTARNLIVSLIEVVSSVPWTVWLIHRYYYNWVDQFKLNDWYIQTNFIQNSLFSMDNNRADNTLVSRVWRTTPLSDSVMTRRQQGDEGYDSPLAGGQMRDSFSPIFSCHLRTEKGHNTVWH